MNNHHRHHRRPSQQPKAQHSAGVPFGAWALGAMLLISLVLSYGGGGGL